MFGALRMRFLASEERSGRDFGRLGSSEREFGRLGIGFWCVLEAHFGVRLGVRGPVEWGVASLIW